MTLALKKIQYVLLLFFLFLLPWQTRYIWRYGELNGGNWEYGTFSIYGAEILLWFILILFFLQNFVKKEAWLHLFGKKKYVVSLLFLAGLVTIGISVTLSENFWVSYQYIFRLLEALAFFVILSRAKDPLAQNERDPSVVSLSQDDRPLWLALWASGVVQGILAIYQFLTQGVFASKWLGMASHEAQQLGASVIEFADERWLRAYGSFGSPNSLGIYLAVLFILGFILYFKTESARNKIIITAGQLLVLSGLMLSFSRAAWLAALVGLVGLVIIILVNGCHSDPEHSGEESLSVSINYDRQRSFTPFRMIMRKDFIKQITFALAVIIFWVVIFFPVFSARFNLHNRLESRSISERKSQYHESLSFIKSNLFFGTGPGVYTYALHKKYPTLPSWDYQPVHNIYLLAIVEMGLLSLPLILLVIISVVKITIKNNLIYLPVLVCLFAAGMFDHWLVSMFTGIIFLWVIVGLGNKKVFNN